MKKILLAILLIGGLAFVGSLVFSENQFSKVPVKVEVSAYDYDTEEFGETVLIENKEELALLIQTFNEANHVNGSYEVSRFENYMIDMTYDDGTTETLRVWFDFDEDLDMFRTDMKDGTFKLKNDEARETLREILE